MEGEFELRNGKSNEEERENTRTIKRRIAYIVPSSFILSGEYKKQEGWEPSFIEINGLKIARVNMIGVVISKEEGLGYPYIAIDDGYGTILVRNFDNPGMFENVNVGDVVLIIGKPREFNGEKYILCEIIKKLRNRRWIEYRKRLFEQKYGKLVEGLDKKEVANERKIGENNQARKEIKHNSHEKSLVSEGINEEKGEKVAELESKEFEDEIKTEEIIIGEEENEGEDRKERNSATLATIRKTENKTAMEIIFDLIKELDKGEGASIDEIVKRANIENVELVLDKLIREGEIFKSAPDRVKIL